MSSAQSSLWWCGVQVGQLGDWIHDTYSQWFSVSRLGHWNHDADSLWLVSKILCSNQIAEELTWLFSDIGIIITNPCCPMHHSKSKILFSITNLYSNMVIFWFVAFSWNFSMGRVEEACNRKGTVRIIISVHFELAMTLMCILYL